MSGRTGLDLYVNDFLTLTSELASVGQGLTEDALVFEFRKGLAPALFEKTTMDPATHKGYHSFETLLQVVQRLEAQAPTTWADRVGPEPHGYSAGAGPSRGGARPSAGRGGPRNPSRGHGGRGRGGRAVAAPRGTVVVPTDPQLRHLTLRVLNRLSDRPANQTLNALLRNDDRCFNCGSTEHKFPACTAPWGSLRTALGLPVEEEQPVAEAAAPPPPPRNNRGRGNSNFRGRSGRGGSSRQ
jgi:hypothetical protein